MQDLELYLEELTCQPKQDNNKLFTKAKQKKMHSCRGTRYDSVC